jgi:hypothetical protein
MYSQKFYRSRVRLAKQLAALPENAGRRRAYLALAENWQRMADMAASAATASATRDVKQKSAGAWEPMLERAMREAGLT